MLAFESFFSTILLYQLTLELLLYLIHDNVDFTLFYCVRLKLDSRFNWGINNTILDTGGLVADGFYGYEHSALLL